MGTKLTGRLKLNRIPKSLVKETEAGDKVIYIDVLERREPDKFGNTHTITLWDKENNETIYLADLKPQEFGVKGKAEPKPEPKKVDFNSDLPF